MTVSESTMAETSGAASKRNNVIIWSSWLVILAIVACVIFKAPAAACSLAGQAPLDKRTLDMQDYKLVWSDEFNGGEIDRSKWDFEVDCWGGGNGEQQCYIDDPSTVRVANGTLLIEPVFHPDEYTGSLEHCTDYQHNSCTLKMPATSGRIRTLHSQSWLYGRFQFRARMPVGDFLWPAIWMLPTDNVYGTWAASGEIDIAEFRGQRPTEMEHTLHYGGMWPNNRADGTGPQQTGINYAKEFVEYTMEWERDAISWYINGQRMSQQTLVRNFWSGVDPNPYTDVRQPFDQRFHLLINLAIGGGFFPYDKYGKFVPERDSKTWTKPFEVDYVRVFQRIQDPCP